MYIMAATQFQRGGTHTNLVPQRWSKNDFKFAFEKNVLLPYMGPSEDAIIQVNKDFTKEQGDKITFALRALLTGDGQTDDGTYSSNSEAMTFYDMSVTLHERGHSVALNGNMTEQSAYDKLRPKGMAALREWGGLVQAADLISALSGLVTKKHIAGCRTGQNAVDASSAQIGVVNQTSVTKGTTATRWFGGGQNSSGAIARVASDSAINSTSNHLFGTDVIEYVHRMAASTVDGSGNAVNPLRPIMIDGTAYLLFLIGPLQKKQLQADTKWKTATTRALPRSVSENWIFSGADGIWDGCVIKTVDKLHRRLGAGGVTADEYFDTTSDALTSGITVERGLLLGAQAACLGWGKLPVWKTGYSDPPHNTKYTVHTDMIYAVKKSVFNSVEHGCICVDTAVIAD
jgi:N4-gp56 family major capsid protein